MSSRACPAPPVLMDHQPYVALPEARALDNKATDVRNCGDYTGSLPLFQQVLLMVQTAHATAATPQTILDVVFAMWKLGETKRALGDLPGAQAVLEQAVALAEPPPVGPRHPRLAQALRDLGRVLRQRGRYDEADATLQRALTMQEQLLGPDHGDVSPTLTIMGESCLDQGNFRRAKGLLKRAVAIAEVHVVPDRYPDKLCGALHLLCGVYKKLKDYEMAQPIAERVLALYEQFLGPHHPNTGAALDNVAECLESQGKLSEAQPLYERSLAIFESVYGPNHPGVATALTNLGDLHRRLGDYRRAKGMFERALAIFEQVYGPQHLDVASTVNHLAGCYRHARDLPQAKTLLERALAIYETQLGRTHPQTVNILKNLAALATIAGRPRQAAALTERAAVAAVAATHQPCGWCGHMDVHQNKKCGQCKAAWYCNEECQRLAWKEHKKHCHGKPAAPPKDGPKNAASASASAAK
jgi:tetratricopeptide (TPR) repeat protein